MPNVDGSPSALESYSSLRDPHLADFFSIGAKRRHLRKAGLIKRNGEVITEKMYQLNIKRKDNHKKQNEQLLRAITDKKLELQRERQKMMNYAIDDLSKFESVVKVKLETARTKCPLPDVNGGCWFGSSAGRYSEFGRRPLAMSAPQGHRRRTRQQSAEPQFDINSSVSGSSVYPLLGSGGSQKTLDNNELNSLLYNDFDGDTSLQPKRSSKRSGRPSSPYLDRHIPAVLLMKPSPASKHTRSRRRLSPLRRQVGFNVGRKSKAAGGHRRNKNATADDNDGSKTRCGGPVRVTMRYLGIPLNLQSERTDERDEIIVEQQHCGGNTLIVYNNKIMAGEEFSFVSQRHQNFPLGVTIYVNGVHDCRLSACCEYRHRLDAQLGAKGGHFAIIGVSGGAPCYRCRAQMRENMKKSRNKGKNSDSDNESGSGDSDAESAAADNMLYIPVESDEESINVRPVDDSESDYSTDNEQQRESDQETHRADNKQPDNGLKIAVPESREPSHKQPESDAEDSSDDSSSSSSSSSDDDEKNSQSANSSQNT